ncbi:ATP-binding protein [Streptomyces sp. NPDC002952]|uniref:ATP-binding protein n=1 Tax=Streptomyces sp. NPDC002952 TaxID=3364673 RepID=UPI003676CE43
MTSDEPLMVAGYALDWDGGCIADARHHAAAFFERAQAEHRLAVPASVVELSQLVVSELVTNARKYTRGPVRMEVRLTRTAVDIIVWESDPAVPVARTADPGRIGQHGLEIVQAVTTSLSIDQEPVGKRITARLALTGTTSEEAAHNR